MKRFLTLFLSLVIFQAVSLPSYGQRTPLRIIVFGAHPDDCELGAGGTAALWAAEGHKVKFVSMTNGDIGHFSMSGGPLALRRTAEAQECAKYLGIVTEVLDIHDGELMPSLENRKTVARLIREWQADIVLFHRPYDSSADHRNVGVLVQDAAVFIMAPFYVPSTKPTPQSPVFLYMEDAMQKPIPFQPSIVIGIDNSADKKWSCIAGMTSQFADADSWQGRTVPNVPKDENERKAFLLERVKQQYVDTANRYRDQLVKLYGQTAGGRIKYAEAFEVCQYGRQPSTDELISLFPIQR